MAGEFAKVARRPIPPIERDAILNKTKGLCYLCKKPITTQWHVEHVIAFSKNPAMDVYGNMLAAHPLCNQKKFNHNLVDVIGNNEFTILTSVIQCDELLPQVKEVLETAKKKKLVSPFLIRVDPETSEIVPDDDGELATIIEMAQEEPDKDLQNCRNLNVADFEEVKELSKGGCGRVYLYNWKGKKVAVKTAEKKYQKC